MADSAVLDRPPDFFSSPADDIFSDLCFDGDLQFSIDDLFDFPESDDSPRPHSGASSSSPARATSDDSGTSAAAAAPDPEPRGPKRKNQWGDVAGSPDPRSEARICRLRRSGGGDEGEDSCLFQAGSEEEERRKARLMRNRESAQLSRQRKKHYVEELEEKVRSMHSTIADLNSRIGFFMAENARLRQQIVGKCAPPGVCVPPVAPVPFPWFPGYAVRPPGAQVPLVPIPRLKSHSTTTATASTKPRRSEGKNGESKVKKVAGVSLLGLLFLMLVVGRFDLRYRSFNSEGGTPEGIRGRVLRVTGDREGSNETNGSGLCGGSGRCRKVVGDRLQRKELEKGTEKSGEKSRERWSPESAHKNSSEPLLASIYIPRNDKLVKINGNLIISSVLASEMAMARKCSKDEGHKGDRNSMKGHGGSDLAVKDIAPEMVSLALAVGDSGMKARRPAGQYVKTALSQKALPSGSIDSYIGNLKPTTADGHLQDWFREGLEGPIFNSGMCSEVFQFDASHDTGNAGGIVPATSVANATTNLTETDSYPTKLKNRRILYPEAMKLNGSALNDTKGGNFGRPQEDGRNKSTSGKSMVVSVLIDPREAGDGSDVNGMMPPRTISRIFVVVLVDEVKYVTYSCMLPFKSTQHLVTA